MHYDVIGDVHGHAAELRALLELLGYTRHGRGYRHTTRKAVFVGDFIDRGPDSPGVVDLARAMVDDGAAFAVLGNHELNARCFHADDEASPGEFLRPHTPKNVRQHQATLDQYQGREGALKAALAWFETLPLWLELEGLRVVHACWDVASMRVLTEAGLVTSDGRLARDALPAVARAHTPAYDAAEVLLKGPEQPLPSGHGFDDKDGTRRAEVRVKWWHQDSTTTWRRIAMAPPDALEHLPDVPMTNPCPIRYEATEPPVVVGHYWLTGEPELLSDNIACVDYSVARHGGKLVALRHDAGTKLSGDRFVHVPRLPSA